MGIELSLILFKMSEQVKGIVWPIPAACLFGYMMPQCASQLQIKLVQEVNQIILIKKTLKIRFCFTLQLLVKIALSVSVMLFTVNFKLLGLKIRDMG